MPNDQTTPQRTPVDDFSSGNQRIRGRAWPCAECRQELSPIGFLVSRIEANPELLQCVIEQQIRTQVAWLKDWCADCPHPASFEFDLPKVAEGSEHLVYLQDTTATVIKVTREDIFGDQYFLKDGLIHQQKSTPLQYLIRLRLWKKLFGAAPVCLGITPLGQFISTQPFISGEMPSQQEVDAYLSNSGITPLKKAAFVWEKFFPEENHSVWIGDTRDENFVKTESGIVPIDIRLGFSFDRITD